MKLNIIRSKSHLRLAFPMMLLMANSSFCMAQRPDYSFNDKVVFYDGHVIPMADIRTFEVLGEGYAKDCFNVYHHGQILEFVDPRGFRLKTREDVHHYDQYDQRPSDYGRGFSAYRVINNDVFYNGKKLDASGNSFKELGHGYAKDAFTVFYLGRKIDDCSASSFKEVGEGYWKDAFSVFFMGRKLADASANSFKVDGQGYAHDAFNTYHLGRKID